MKVMITGATGYVGAALTATFLGQGADVICPGRDPDGSRTRRAVKRAAQGLGHELSDSLLSRLHVLPYVPGSLGRGVFDGLDAIWHAAAFMPYTPAKLGEAFEFNVVGTSELYRQLGEHAPEAHFFYVSTAYIGGLGGMPVPEAIIPAPLLNNAYLVSKWSTEMSLHALSIAGGPSLTIYRPPGVVAHSESGWYDGKPYGMYLFFTALKAAAATGARMAHVDIDPDVLHPYIPIDDLSANAWALTQALYSAPRFRVVHDLGTWHSNRLLIESAAEVLQLTVDFGSGESDADALVDQIILPNKPFNLRGKNRKYLFAEGELQRTLGDQHHRRPLTHEGVRRIAEFYKDVPLPERARA